MDAIWNDTLPIYRQLRDRVVAMILEGVLADGDPLPSVRSVAADYRLNPLTVLKGYQQLAEEQLVEKKRGRGMFVSEGARRALTRTSASGSSRTSGRALARASSASVSAWRNCSRPRRTRRPRSRPSWRRPGPKARVRTMDALRRQPRLEWGRVSL